MGVLFLGTGLVKLVGLSAVKHFFAMIGLPLWMVPLAGVVELAFGLLLLRRRTYQYGALGVLVWMVFAALSHVMTGDQLYFLFFNAILINLCMWILEKDPPSFLNVRRPFKRAPLGRR